VNHFETRDGGLACEDVDLTAVAEAVGTPVYVYSSATLERHYAGWRTALDRRREALGEAMVAFAVKACPNLSVLATLARLGCGADTVSEGEIRRALKAGVPPPRIVFSGVGKTDAELAFALEVGVLQINVEAPPEMDRLASIAQAKGLTASVAIRVNPGVGAGGHAKITTGGAADKFGVPGEVALELYARAARTPGLRPVGLACHIGSQISDLEPLRRAFIVLRGLVERLRSDGLGIERVDVGGGLGVPYFDQPDPPSPDDYAAMLAGVFGGLGVEIACEPGRAIVANAGVLLARVIHVHARPDRRLLVVDAGMNDLLRPALYDAFHDIRPVRPRAGAEVLAYDVVGPVCESSDVFARGRELARLEAGDLVAFMSAGAYGAAMASEYNSRPLAPEVLVRGAEWRVVRRRPSWEEMLAREAGALGEA
jgi:diaminopimelate decarboxylase